MLQPVGSSSFFSLRLNHRSRRCSESLEQFSQRLSACGIALAQSGQNRELVGRHFAALTIGNKLKAHSLAFMQTAEAGALYGANVDEGISAAVIWCDEAKALLGIEPFHGSRSHGKPFLD